MKGFELEINGETYSGALNDGVISIIITKAHGDIYLNFGGLRGNCIDSVAWMAHRYLAEGDVINIEVVEMEREPTPCERTYEPEPDEQMLARYKALTKRYREKGWI